MVDRISINRRSWNMGRIKGKDTSPEKKVRQILHKLGYRFRLHINELPGRPDIVLKKYNTIIFVNGCFWHRHINCKYAYTPKSNREFWGEKFSKNIERDKKNQQLLKRDGWKIGIIWECQTKNEDELIDYIGDLLINRK